MPIDLMELLKPGVAKQPSTIGRAPGGVGVGDEAGIGDAPPGELVPSARLHGHPEALEHFEFYRRTAGFGHLKPVDQPLLEMLCIQLAVFDRVLDEYLTKETLVQQAMSGMDVASPYFQYMMKLGETIRKLCMELAFTPIERARLKSAGNTPDEKAKEAHRKAMHAKYLSGQTGGQTE